MRNMRHRATSRSGAGASSKDLTHKPCIPAITTSLMGVFAQRMKGGTIGCMIGWGLGCLVWVLRVPDNRMNTIDPQFIRLLFIIMHIRQRTRQRIATGLMILFWRWHLVPIYQILAKMSPGGRFVQLRSPWAFRPLGGR